MSAVLIWIPVVVVLCTAVGLLISRDWRWSLGLLVLQYFGAFWLVYVHWPLSMAAVKLVTGWMATAALGMTRLSVHPPTSTETGWPQGNLFRVFAAITVAITAAPLALGVVSGLPSIGLAETLGGMLLIGLGMLHLGMTTRPMWVTVGLLTVLSGFEILYAAVENSILVAALLAAINLGLALVGSYLLIASTAAEESNP